MIKRFAGLLIAGFALFGTVGCGPVKLEMPVNIGPSHTAFRIPLESTEKSEIFGSAEYLKNRKVRTTQYLLPQRSKSTGRMWYSYEYIPTEMVLIVDRAPVTGTWTGKKAIKVETVESVNANIEVKINASVHEEDAHLYLYHFGGFVMDKEGKLQPFKAGDGHQVDPSLQSTVDINIRGYIQAFLSGELGSYDMNQLNANLAKSIDKAFEDTKKFYKERGVTIEFLSSVAGVTYDNKLIQTTLDQRVIVANEIITANQEKKTREKENLQLVATAQNEVDRAQERYKARDAVLLQAQLEYVKDWAEATKIAFSGWNGKPAKLVPQGSLFLFGLDSPTGGQPVLPDFSFEKPVMKPADKPTDKK